MRPLSFLKTRTAALLAAASQSSSFLAPRHLLRPLSGVARDGGADPTTPPPPSDDTTCSAAATDTVGGGRNLESLFAQAQEYLNEKNADGAFESLARAHGIDPTSSRLSGMFEACLKVKVELAEERICVWKKHLDGSDDDAANDLSERDLNNIFQDRMGLSSLYIDAERYDEAGTQLRRAIEEATFWLERSLQRSLVEGEEGGRAAAPAEEVQYRANLSITEFGHWQPQLERARYLLYRTNAACCQWDAYFEDGDRLRQSLIHNESQRLLHPFDALKFPCVSLELASGIARSYASRALEAVGAQSVEGKVKSRSAVTTSIDDSSKQRPHGKIRIGYVSPDFTSKHPLAFLMQHVFRCHDKPQFEVYIYSISSSTLDNGPEVRAICESSDKFSYLSPSSMNPLEMYEQMLEDKLDVLIDLCGYAGTSVVSEIMASRCCLSRDHPTRRFPFHVSYMGFPGSVGSSTLWDYSVFDATVIPPSEMAGLREHYKEALVYMPHCYFVNSHKTSIGCRNDGVMVLGGSERGALREKNGIGPDAFVYCCHSRPDKIDPSTFRSWMCAITRVVDVLKVKGRNKDAACGPVLWMLRSGDEMERNLRRWVCREFGEDAEACLVFSDVVSREEHLARLGVADVFLDTPAYNAHTLGCDALYAGVPMISLLRPLERDSVSPTNPEMGLPWSADADSYIGMRSRAEDRSIATGKLASRVGASLLSACGLGDLVCPSMAKYEDAMVRCALDEEWFGEIRQRLLSNRNSSPLFDTEGWVRCLEAACRKMLEMDRNDVDCVPDIFVSDDCSYDYRGVI